MAVCTQCGTPNPDENKFCSGCGAPLVGSEVAAAAAAAAAAVIPEAPAEPEIPVPAAPAEPEAPAPAQPEAPVPELTFDATQPVYTPPQPAEAQAQPVYSPPVYSEQKSAEPVATGGLVAWAIVTILLCWIPGIVALINALGINKCATAEEQQRKISQTKTWCLVGTVLGVVYLIYMYASGTAARLLG